MPNVFKSPGSSLCSVAPPKLAAARITTREVQYSPDTGPLKFVKGDGNGTDRSHPRGPQRGAVALPQLQCVFDAADREEQSSCHVFQLLFAITELRTDRADTHGAGGGSIAFPQFSVVCETVWPGREEKRAIHIDEILK